jgi:hypothetical protein
MKNLSTDFILIAGLVNKILADIEFEYRFYFNITKVECSILINWLVSTNFHTTNPKSNKQLSISTHLN